MFSNWTCYIVQNGHVTHIAIVGQFLLSEGQSDGYMNARMRERNMYRSHGGIVLELRRTWGKGDVVSAIVSLVPMMFYKALQEPQSIRIA